MKKIRELYEGLMEQTVYYDGEYMCVQEAMDRCASLLCGFLLKKTPFVPFVCTPNERLFLEIYDMFRNIDWFCAPLGEGAAVSITSLPT